MNNTTKYGIREDKSKEIFVGSYLRAGAKLTHHSDESIRFVIGTRQKTCKSKPEHFLLLMQGRSKPAIYFSSMYPTQDPNLFEVEYRKVDYLLTLDSDKAELVLLNQASKQAA